MARPVSGRRCGAFVSGAEFWQSLGRGVVEVEAKCELRVTVTDAERRPIAKQKVGIERGGRILFRRPRVTVTRDDGTASFAGLEPGEYNVVLLDAYEVTSMTTVAVRQEMSEVTIVAKE